jgi:MFS family permease
MNLTAHVAGLSQRRPYYGWYVVGVCNAVAFMTWGIGVFNQGVFLGFFVVEYGWSRAELSFGPTVFYLWAGLLGIPIGRFVDRWGPRPVLVVGALSLGAGTIALGLVRATWHVYPAFLVLGTGYACLHTVTLGAIVSRWFVRDRARAMAAATFGAGVGGMILAPLNATLLDRWGALAGGLTLAIIAVVGVIPLALWIVKDGPESLGLRVDGQRAPATQTGTSPSADAHVWTLARAVRTRAFWAIAFSFQVVMIAQGGFLVHQVLILEPTFGFNGAAAVVSLTTIAGTVGRAGFALIGNRLTPSRLAGGAFLLQAAGLLLAGTSQAVWPLVLGSVAFGLTMGIIVAIQPVIAAECFGRHSFGRVYGPLYTTIQLGTALGPLLYGVLAASTGSYQVVLIGLACSVLLAAIGTRWAVAPTTTLLAWLRP